MEKRLTLYFAAALLLFQAIAFAGCGNPEKPAGQIEEQASATETESQTDPHSDTEPAFKFEDYGGDTFTVFMRNSSASTYPALYIIGEDNGALCDEAALARNLQVEEKFNIHIGFIESEKVSSSIEKDIKSGDPGYDLLLDERISLAAKVTSGLLYDFNKLPTDYTRPWWDINCADGYSVNGKLFLMANDVSIARFSNAYILYFNKRIVTEFKLDEPYALEASGKWTLERFLNMVKGVSDIPADGSVGTYGMLSGVGGSNGTEMHLLTGCGIKYTALDSQKNRVIIVGEQLDRIGSVLDSVFTVMTDPNYSLKYKDASGKKPETLSNYSNYFDHARSLFAEGHFLFLHGSMGISSHFAEMKDDYGVIVNPKFNTDQDRYYHRIDPYANIFAIPNSTSVDMDRVALISDYWAYVSRSTVIPAYYEVTIKTKRVNDPTAPEMIDKVRETIMYEMSDVFKLEISDAIDTGYQHSSLVKVWDSYKKRVQFNLDRLNKQVGELE